MYETWRIGVLLYVESFNRAIFSLDIFAMEGECYFKLSIFFELFFVCPFYKISTKNDDNQTEK